MVAGVFHYRLVKHERHNQAVMALPWKKHIIALYTGSALIMIRSIFRVVEYLMGNAGYLMSHEVFLYVFDAVLMFLVMALFNVVHPSEITLLTKENAQLRTSPDTSGEEMIKSEHSGDHQFGSENSMKERV
jgi:hypothetical protein